MARVQDNFLPLLDCIEKETKVAASKNILSSVASSTATASDPVMLHALFDVARNLHDSVDSLSFSDERRQISQLIVDFIRKVFDWLTESRMSCAYTIWQWGICAGSQIDFGRDLEKQLSTYVECRQAFTNLDAVTRELVLRVALLTVRAHGFMKGKHNKKTAAFVKVRACLPGRTVFIDALAAVCGTDFAIAFVHQACLAYCHITIPSLDDTFSRLQLFLQCAQVALLNNMIAQGLLSACFVAGSKTPLAHRLLLCGLSYPR